MLRHNEIMTGPLAPPAAKVCILEILERGRIRFTKYCRGRMAERKVTEVDVMHVLRGGVVEPAELEGQAWRYRVRAGRIHVVVEIDQDVDGAFVLTVTVWRKDR